MQQQVADGFGDVGGVLQGALVDVGEAFEQEGGAHAASDQGGDFDVVGPTFDVEGLGEAEQAPFAGVVGRGVGPGAFGGGGDDVDDVAAAVFAHEGEDGFGHEEGAVEVDADDALPLVMGEVFDGFGDVNARIIDQHVDLAVAIAHLVDQRLDAIGGGDVEVKGDRVALVAFNLLGELGGLLMAQVSDDDFQAGFCQAATGGRAQAACAPGDNGDFAVKGRDAVGLFGQGLHNFSVLVFWVCVRWGVGARHSGNYVAASNNTFWTECLAPAGCFWGDPIPGQGNPAWADAAGLGTAICRG